MYQSAYYSYKTYKYTIRDDKQGWLTFDYQPTYFQRIPEYQEGAQPVLTGGWAMPTKKYSKTDPDLLERDINKELLILRDLYYDNDEEVPTWHNLLYLDIECEMGGALSVEYIKRAPMPLTSLAIIDKTTQQQICFIIDHAIKPEDRLQEINQDGKHIIPCDSESDLMVKFLDKWQELDPTIVITWNEPILIFLTYIIEYVMF